MTSPVERISGPRKGFTPSNRENGKTTALTATWPGSRFSRTPCSARVRRRDAVAVEVDPEVEERPRRTFPTHRKAGQLPPRAIPPGWR